MAASRKAASGLRSGPKRKGNLRSKRVKEQCRNLGVGQTIKGMVFRDLKGNFHTSFRSVQRRRCPGLLPGSVGASVWHQSVCIDQDLVYFLVDPVHSWAGETKAPRLASASGVQRVPMPRVHGDDARITWMTLHCMACGPASISNSQGMWPGSSAQVVLLL